jgi:hypothetical protein
VRGVVWPFPSSSVSAANRLMHAGEPGAFFITFSTGHGTEQNVPEITQ